MGMRSYPRSCGVITASCKLSTCTDRELIVREILDGVRDPVTNLSISSIGILQVTVGFQKSIFCRLQEVFLRKKDYLLLLIL